MRNTIYLLIIGLVFSCFAAGCGGNQRGEAEARLKKLTVLLMQTTDKNNWIYPDMSSPEALKKALTPALEVEKKSTTEGWNDDVFVHPSSNKPFVPNVKLSKADAAMLEDQAKVIAFYAPEPDGAERLVSYADGRVEWVKETDWPTQKKAGKAQ